MTARSAASVARGRSHLPAAPGPLRLLSGQDSLGSRIGLQLVAAWTALAVVAVTGAWRTLTRAGRAGLIGMTVWLLLGSVLFSVQGSLRPRYLEAFDPAVAACIGAGALALIRDVALPGPVSPSLGVLAAVLTASASPASAPPTPMSRTRAPSARSGVARAAPERLPAATRVAPLRGGDARSSPAAPLIVRDGRPVLVLTAAGRAVVGVDRLAGLVAAARSALPWWAVPAGPSAARRVAGWVRAHGRDVSRAAGGRRRNALRAREARDDRPRPPRVVPGVRGRSATTVAAVVAATALATALGASLWLVLAAAERLGALAADASRSPRGCSGRYTARCHSSRTTRSGCVPT